MSDPTPNPHTPVPSITAQRAGVSFVDIPRPFRRNYQYFNPSLADWQGRRWLVARRRRLQPHPGHNGIVLWPLVNGAIPPTASPRPLKFYSIRPDEHFEDPRAIVIDGELHVSYSTFHTRGQYVAQGFARINAICQAISITIPVYGTNGPTLAAQRGNEKNWTWFHDDDADATRFVYAPAPQHTVVTIHADGLDESHAPGLAWRYGLPRGGTPPVYIPLPPPPVPVGRHTRRRPHRGPRGLWWTFFHSSIDLSPIPPRRRYYMGAYAFEPDPPFRPVLATPEPLLTASESDPREPSAPFCVFPCGALLDAGVWTVSLGVNDCACALMRMTHAELETLVTPVV